MKKSRMAGNAAGGPDAAQADVPVADLWYCDIMPNITVTVSEQTYRRARVRAAELSTSVSAVVARTLDEFAAAGTDAEVRKRRFEELRSQTPIWSAGQRLSREDLYRKPGKRR
jgi:hypothetical protein